MVGVTRRADRCTSRTARASRSPWAALLAVALVAAAVGALVPAAPPAVADGNEAPNAPLAARSISAGGSDIGFGLIGSQTCALLADATVKCWGANESGQLGQGNANNLGDASGEMAALAPVNLGAGRTAVELAAGGQHTCARLDNGSVKCWGANGSGQLGQNNTTTLGDGAGEMAALSAVPLAGNKPAVAVAAGYAHTCAIIHDLPSDELECWGLNANGQLGLGNTNNLGDQAGELSTSSAHFVDLGNPSGFILLAVHAVTAGQFHTCALVDDGSGHDTVKCWGANTNGQLGYGDTNDRGDGSGEMGNSLPTVDLGTGRRPLAISAGDQFTCALLDNHQVKCWGFGAAGRLGQGSTATLGDNAGEMGDNLPPVDLGTGRTAVAISAGGQHACALLDNGTVKCWGAGASGQLGKDGTANLGDGPNEMGNNLVAVNLGAGRTATAVTTGVAHSCALLDDGTIKCWGNGAKGQLGQDSTTNLGDGAGEMAALAPARVGGLSVQTIADETAVDVGAAVHVHVTVTNTGRVSLSGVTIVDATAPGCAVTPFTLAVGAARTVDCTHLAAVADVAAGYRNTASVTATQVSTAISATATAATGVRLAAPVVSAGKFFTCARFGDGTVKCWGVNDQGQLGQGNTATQGDASGEMQALAPVNLGTGRTATAVAAGGTHACALLDNGTVKCWGDSANGQLGLDSTNDRGDGPGEMGDSLPAVNLGAGRTATAIAAGLNHTCALLDNGSVKCWGLNDHGQLGQGNANTLGDQPGEMAALAAVDQGTPAVTAVSVGDASTCVLRSDGTVKCWGQGGSGQNGLDDTADRGDNPGEIASASPVNLGSGRTARAISSGGGDNCALLDNGTVKCWGYNGSGRLGQGNTNNLGDAAGEMAALNPVSLGTGRSALAVDAGAGHTCVVLDNATVKCWGAGANGRLGSDGTANLGDGAGEMGDSLGAVNLGAGRTATGIVAGQNHTCAQLDDGTLKCWGANANGELGQNSINDLGDAAGEMAALPPALAAGLSVQVSADETSVVVGATVHLHVTVTNTGFRPLSNVTITDPAATSCQVAAFSVPVASSHTVDCTHVATAGEVAGGYHDSASAVATEVSTSVSSNTANVTVASPSGGISGTLTEAGSGTPLSSVWVAALRTTDFSLAGTAVPDGSGHFAIPLAAGTYFLYLIGSDGTHATGFFGAPTTITVTASSTTTVNPTATSTRGSIAGAVTETGSGAPIPGALVFTISTATGAVGPGAVTNGSGAYSVAGVNPGSDWVGVADPTGAHGARYSPSSVDAVGSTPVTVSAGAAATANVNLPTQTTTGTGAPLTGTITETGTGAPLSGVFVMALSTADFHLARAGVTNASGQYSLDVAAGTYKLAFLDSNGLHAPEWYADLPISTVVTSATTVTAPAAANADLARTTGTMAEPSSPARRPARWRGSGCSHSARRASAAVPSRPPTAATPSRAWSRGRTGRRSSTPRAFGPRSTTSTARTTPGPRRSTSPRPPRPPSARRSAAERRPALVGAPRQPPNRLSYRCRASAPGRTGRPRRPS